MRRILFRIARDTARFAECWPTMWRERASTIWDGVWCWWSLLIALYFLVSSPVMTVVVVGASSCGGSSGVVAEDPSVAAEEKDRKLPC